MVEDIKLGSPFTWTPQSPKESGKNVDEFYAFVDDQLACLKRMPTFQGLSFISQTARLSYKLAR